jgi:hypothetical protein
MDGQDSVASSHCCSGISETTVLTHELLQTTVDLLKRNQFGLVATGPVI